MKENSRDIDSELIKKAKVTVVYDPVRKLAEDCAKIAGGKFKIEDIHYLLRSIMNDAIFITIFL